MLADLGLKFLQHDLIVINLPVFLAVKFLFNVLLFFGDFVENQLDALQEFSNLKVLQVVLLHIVKKLDLTPLFFLGIKTRFLRFPLASASL